MRKRGSVLVGLLWCLAVLAVVVTSVLYTARMELMVVKNYSDSLQAYYLAVAGAEKAKALIFHEAVERKRSAQHHSGALFDSPEDFQDVELGRGVFRVLRQGGREEGGQIVYGISDEESRLNVNLAGLEQLQKLYGMTPELAAAIIDWRDEDNNASAGGAESEYYATLRRPYIPRDGNFQTARELLMVRGVEPELLLGEDANQNGLLDAEEDDRNANGPADNGDGILDHGWAGYLTFETVTQNTTATGEEKVDVQTATESELTGIPGITQEIAKAIIAHRGENRLENIADLMDVAAPAPQGSPGAQARPGQPGQTGQPGEEQPPQEQEGQPPARSGRGGPQQGSPRGRGATGPKLINEELFLQVADQVKTSPETARRGLININTASVPVLLCLEGMTEELAQAIVNYRSSAGFFQNVGYLLKVDGITRETFQRLAPKVTVRSENFRIISEGAVTASGARKRIETIVRLTSTGIETISYRENL